MGNVKVILVSKIPVVKTRLVEGIAFLAFGILNLITAHYTLRAYDIAIENNVQHELVDLAPELYKVLVIFGIFGLVLFGVLLGTYLKK